MYEEHSTPVSQPLKPNNFVTETPQVVIRGTNNDEFTSVEVKIPPNGKDATEEIFWAPLFVRRAIALKFFSESHAVLAYDYFDEVMKVIDEFFDNLIRNTTSNTNDKQHWKDENGETTNFVQDTVKRSLVSSFYPVIVPPSKPVVDKHFLFTVAITFSQNAISVIAY